MRAAAADPAIVASPYPAGRFLAPGASPSWRILAAMVATVAVLAAVLRFSVDRVDLPIMIQLQGALVAAALLLRGRGAGRIATAIEAAVLVLAATMATACLSVLLATTGLPYRDTLLAAADAGLPVPWQWLDMYRVLRGHDGLVAVMCAIYRTLLWQPFLLVAVLALTGREWRCWRFVHAWFLALIACIVVFPLLPAAGAYVHYGLSQADIPALTVDIAWRQVAVLEQIRSGALHALSPASMTGLISFPSFHACGAVLLLWGFWGVPLLRVPFAVLNVAMLLTAPLIGSHYFVDVIAGVALAVAAIAVANSAGRRAVMPG